MVGAFARQRQLQLCGRQLIAFDLRLAASIDRRNRDEHATSFSDGYRSERVADMFDKKLPVEIFGKVAS